MPNERILVLEDHVDLLKQVCDVLIDAGYRVEPAATGAEALTLARHAAFNLLIADVFLPDNSGIQVFQQIRAIRPDLAGVAITGHSTWELALDALRAGFVGFLVKPFVPEQLVATVVSALEQEELRRDNARLRAMVPLYELSRAFMGTFELKDLLNQIVDTVRAETRAQVVSLMLLGEDQTQLHIAAASGLPVDVVETQTRNLGNGIAGRVAQTGEPLMIAEGLPLQPEIRRAMTKPDILSALSVPLRARGRVIGVLNLSRPRGSDPFTHGDLELATVFGGQAAIAIDQARLIADLRQLSDLSQRLARTVDLDDACAVILRVPVEMLNARSAALWLSDGSPAPTLRTIGMEDTTPPAINLERVVEEFKPDPNGGWLILGLRHGDKTFGALAARLATAKPPGDERLRTLRTLAHVAGAVIESHRLRAREAQAFQEVDRAVRADLNLRDLLDRLLNEMIETCQAQGGAIYLWDDERGSLDPWVQRGLAAQTDWTKTLFQAERARQIQDAQADQFILGAPMTIGNRAQGVAVLTRSAAAGEFRPSQVDLLSTLTSAAALAVRNAQLYARSEEAAIAEERTRIAREIHDGLAQDLSFLVLKIGVAQRLATQGKDKEFRKELGEISEQLRRDARDVRRIIFALRPLDIETLGFMPALQKFAKEFGSANEIEVQFNAQGDFAHLPPKLETALFRLTQETLNNARKHAQAQHVWIELALEDRRKAILRVRDDGVGFDLPKALAAAQARGSVGLVQMRERAERAGGSFAIETAPGKGTTIQVELPVREA